VRSRQTKEQKIAKRRERWSEAFELVAKGEALPRTAECVALIDEEGLGIPQIAERLGVGTSTVGAALCDPTRARDRARKRERHGICKGCGTKTFNSGSYEVPDRCARCDRALRREEAQARVIKAIKDFHRRYGRPPTSTDWNIALARRVSHPERLAEIQQIHRDRSWPPVTSAQKAFGSWNKAIEAAGFTPVRSGQWQRKKLALKHQNERKVAPMKSSLEVIEAEIERNGQRQERLVERETKLREEREAVAKETTRLQEAAQFLRRGDE
jgi:HNH endonuclease